MNNYKHQLTRNKYDDAYVMGYHNGYHAVKYDNQYDEDTLAEYHIKFKHGYTAGKLLRVKEEAGLLAWALRHVHTVIMVRLKPCMQ